MAKLKGYNKLNKKISAQLAPFGIDKAICTTEFAYYFDDNHLEYKLTIGTYGDIYFQDFVRDRFDYDNNAFVLSLLHEIGHSQANENITDDVYEFCFNEKERIGLALAETDDPAEIKRLQNQYFNLPDEIMATAWGVNYAKKHPKKVKKIWKNCLAAIVEFYKKNDLEG